MLRLVESFGDSGEPHGSKSVTRMQIFGRRKVSEMDVSGGGPST